MFKKYFAVNSLAFFIDRIKSTIVLLVPFNIQSKKQNAALR